MGPGAVLCGCNSTSTEFYYLQGEWDRPGGIKKNVWYYYVCKGLKYIIFLLSFV